MADETHNKDENGYSFIQEQIASTKKGRIKRMIYSVIWTIALGCIFGLVAAVVLCLAEPAIAKFLGNNQEKNTVEFPTITPTEGLAYVEPTPTPTPTAPAKDTESGSDDEDDLMPDTVVIEQTILANINDLSNIYMELRKIAKEVNTSIVDVVCTTKAVDVFNSEYEVVKSINGLIVGNNQVDLLILVSLDKIEGTNDIRIKINDNLLIKGSLQDYDKDLNLGVIAVSLTSIPDSVEDALIPATLGESYALVVGTPIIALGSPNGYIDSMEVGMITNSGYSKYITDNKVDLFNTDINYNKNGDGVIANLKGEVIGIITNTLKDDDNQEVNTVIGISKIKKIINSMVNNVDRSYFGIKGMDMTETALLEAEIENGICITEVMTESPALDAGFQSGDVITAIDDVLVLSVNAFNTLLHSYTPGTEIKVTIIRKVKGESKEMNLSVELGKTNNK
ncbi:MAG: S1C family serine protease [Anaerocolumna sp.]